MLDYKLKKASAVSLFVFACSSDTDLTEQPILTGAIYTTLEDGTQVNANIYAAKEDVYLDGGPGPNAPPNAGGLPTGEYYFQVTIPSGSIVLSSDGLECRKFRVADGVIVEYLADGCAAPHDTGLDADQAGLGAITIQLFPYANTLNPGGEYKVWVTSVADHEENGGFWEPDSKTDNYKVRGGVVLPYCGDGNVDEGEVCDDGNSENGDGCSSTCQVEPRCGDGNVDAGETCDDGNSDNGDGCSSTCQVEPRCGDGNVDAGEACDDGNNADGDGCSASCQVEPRCGDGNVDAGETCDDGNNDSGDGCSAACEVEKAPCCGDGVLDAGEQCDDGNTTSGDGCSASCQKEHVCLLDCQ